MKERRETAKELRRVQRQLARTANDPNETIVTTPDYFGAAIRRMIREKDDPKSVLNLIKIDMNKNRKERTAPWE